MTTEEKLAAIKALPEGTYRDTRGDVIYGVVLSPTNFAWLIAKVSECNEACEKGKAIIHDIADGSEYRRGREDERANCVTWMNAQFEKRIGLDTETKRMTGVLCYSLMQAIERGEHVAEVKDAKPTL